MVGVGEGAKGINDSFSVIFYSEVTTEMSRIEKYVI